MNWKSYFKWLSIAYKIEINQEIQNSIKEHFGDNLNIYTEQDMYEQSRKLIQNYKDRYLQINYNKFYK